MKKIGLILLIVILIVGGVGAYLVLSPFEVVKPTNFEVSDLSLSSSKVEPKEPVNVSVNVSNVGDKLGECNVVLKVDGTTENSKTVSLNSGEETTVTFTLRRKTKKTYSVEIGSLSDSFEVVAPAEFQVGNLTVEPRKTDLGNPVEVSFRVTNIGGMEGTHDIEVKSNGGVLRKEEVKLEGGEEESISFDVREDAIGTYDLTVGGLNSSVNIKPNVHELVTARYFDPETKEYVEEKTFDRGDTVWVYLRYDITKGSSKKINLQVEHNWKVYGPEGEIGYSISSDYHFEDAWSICAWFELPTDWTYERGYYTIQLGIFDKERLVRQEENIKFYLNL